MCSPRIARRAGTGRGSQCSTPCYRSSTSNRDTLAQDTSAAQHDGNTLRAVFGAQQQGQNVQHGYGDDDNTPLPIFPQGSAGSERANRPLNIVVGQVEGDNVVHLTRQSRTFLGSRHRLPTRSPLARLTRQRLRTGHLRDWCHGPPLGHNPGNPKSQGYGHPE